MDMTILLLVVGGNILLFWGLFKILSLTIFKKTQKEGSTELEDEVKLLERELRRL